MDANGHQRLDDTCCEHEDTTDSLPCIPTMCCCGNDDCAFQQQNSDAFASLDENLRKAGRLGKVSVSCVARLRKAVRNLQILAVFVFAWLSLPYPTLRFLRTFAPQTVSPLNLLCYGSSSHYTPSISPKYTHML
jgi:hypothetical protein